MCISERQETVSQSGGWSIISLTLTGQDRTVDEGKECDG